MKNLNKSIIVYGRYSILIIILSCLLIAEGVSQDARAILEKIDQNMSSENRITESTMVIHGRRNNRTVTSKSWSVGTIKSFTEYLSPASERGTKMLKLENQLWIYSPSTDRTIQISGHMLRQSVMGSDLSYEDMMEDRKLSDMYDAAILKEENFQDREVWVLELTAKVSDIAYHKQMVWVDKNRFVPLQQELYAKSGQLLKKLELKDIQNIQGKWFPTTMIYKDVLKGGDGTEFKITKIQFDQEIPDYIFSKAALKK